MFGIADLKKFDEIWILDIFVKNTKKYHLNYKPFSYKYYKVKQLKTLGRVTVCDNLI